MQTSDYISLSQFLRSGGELSIGMDVRMETHVRKPMQTGFILDWSVPDKFKDLISLGRYGDCTAQIVNDKTDKAETWPFTMLYVKQQ